VRRTKSPSNYEPWFGAHADVIGLEPGRMLHWPLNCPHRIVNQDWLNVSFTTEHMRRELRNAYAINYGNGVLRRALGLEAYPGRKAGLGFMRGWVWRPRITIRARKRAGRLGASSTSRSMRGRRRAYRWVPAFALGA
jgi:hypothetical protein